MIANAPFTINEHQTTLLDHALDYARRGWSIIPVIGKKAVGTWKPYQDNPADESTLRQLFARKGITGLAVVLGRVSGGLAVRDFDDADAYHAWATANPDEAARLPTVRTARGYHVYGWLDAEDYVDFGDGELRADSKHYVLVPPSVHPSGAIYTWEIPLPFTPAELPPFPPSLIAQKGEKTQQPKQLKQLIACVPQAAVRAIDATLPDGPGKRNRKVFHLARRLKAIPDLDKSPEMLKAIVVEWHRRALPVITTKAFDETWSDFRIAWPRVKVPYGSLINAAYEAARRNPQLPIDGDADLGVLAAFCWNLSITAGDRPFFLACRTVVSLFGVCRMTAWRWLQDLQFYGIIQQCKKGSLKARKATEWRYVAALK